MSDIPTAGKTPKCRINFPVVFEPQENRMSGKVEYSCQLLISKDEDISEMEQAIEAALDARFGTKRPRGLNMGIRDGDEEKPDAEDYENCWFVNLKTNVKPLVVDHNKDRIEDPANLQSGDWVFVSFNTYAYDTAGNKGAAFGLRNIQKIKNGDPIAGARSRNADEFDIIDDPTLGESPDDL